MKPLLIRYGIPAACGVLLAFSFPTYHWYPLAWVALAPLFYLSAKTTPRTAALQFFLAGHVFNTLVLQWLWANVFWAGGWAVLGQQALCVVLALFWAALGYFWRWGRGWSRFFVGPLCTALLWAGIEWLQANLFTGFGWTALGYAQAADLPFAQLAAVGGVSLLSAILVYVNAALAEAYRNGRRGWKHALAALLVVAAAHGAGWTMVKPPATADPELNVGVVQPNFPQAMKWDRLYRIEMVARSAEWSYALDADRPVDLFVWPEALVMENYERPEYLDILTSLARATDAAVFTGAVRVSEDIAGSYNSAALVLPDGSVGGYYDKVHLAPFGEYVPWFLPFLEQIVPGGSLLAGAGLAPLPLGERSFGPLICFEVLFAPMAEEHRREGADFLAVVTNLAWFGDSNAIPQEFEIARMRAIETRLPLVHSANTGISAIFDPYGRALLPYLIMMDADGFREFDPKQVDPIMLRSQRCMLAYPVPAKADSPLPGGPVTVPWVLGLLGVLLVLVGWRRGRQRERRADLPARGGAR